MNLDRYYMCSTFGDIFRVAAEMSYDMESFTNLYMKSDFCRRSMDATYSRFQVADAEECLDFILPEISDRLKKYDGRIFDPYIAEWIGYTYKDLYERTKIPSAKLVDLVTFSAMCHYYPGLHTIEEDNVIDVIIRDKIKDY